MLKHWRNHWTWVKTNPTCGIVFLNQKLDPQPTPSILFSFSHYRKRGQYWPNLWSFPQFSIQSKTPHVLQPTPSHHFVTHKTGHRWRDFHFAWHHVTGHQWIFFTDRNLSHERKIQPLNARFDLLPLPSNIVFSTQIIVLSVKNPMELLSRMFWIASTKIHIPPY